MRYKILAIAGATLFILAIVGIYIQSHQQPPSSPANHATQPEVVQRYWIMTSTALSEVTANSKALAALKNDTIYVSAYNPTSAPTREQNLHIIPTVVYQSESKFATDVTNGTIPSYVKAILYDNEPWPLTPPSEQSNPVFYYQQAYTLAHSHGYTMIATPVPNMLAPAIAPYADIVDIQAQYAQASATTYLEAVKSVIEHVKQANPQTIILSGLSTNPTAGDPTPQQLLNIASATYGDLTHGWWLNIPKAGVACPRCNQPRPDIAVSFLQMLGPTKQ